MEARFYSKLNNGKVQCHLCPHQCVLTAGQTGICRVRRNEEGNLLSLNYGKILAKHLDPIEKKPLYHFFPGSKILSIGSVGCNMRCTFCQNCEISQVGIEEYEWIGSTTVSQIVEEAQSFPDNIGLAYTYNEPTVFYEFMVETARAIHVAGLKNVMVSNGFISVEPLQKLLENMDAFNIDLKAFTDVFYKSQTHSQLTPILESLKIVKKSGKHLELTTLVIPGLNDDTRSFNEMIAWIVNELGTDTVLHLSRYFPNYKLTIPETSEKSLIRLYELAKDKLDYVYVGNVPSESMDNNTYCKNCNSLVIRRDNYQTKLQNLTRKGCCKNCNQPVIKNISFG